jgi:hypothetical protein
MDGFQPALVHLKEVLKQGDILLTLGAGDIWEVGKEMLEALADERPWRMDGTGPASRNWLQAALKVTSVLMSRCRNTRTFEWVVRRMHTLLGKH